MPLGKIFKVLIARGEAVQRANLATQQALLGLTPETDWQTVTTANPNWQNLFAALCDSPPEVKLLNALIGAYGLMPHDGVLQSSMLKLQLQVPMKPYRVDFLINDKIIVEVDGKTYHSSRDAVRRDLDRDNYFREQGFAVIRIPAQDIFTDAHKAVAKIMRSGELKPKQNVATPKKFSLTHALNGIGQALSDVSDFVDQSRATMEAGENALRWQKNAFYSERKTIDSAIADSLKWLDAEKYRSQSADHAAWYDAANGNLPWKILISIPDLEPPEIIADDPKNDALQRSYAFLLKERSKYFSGVREKLRLDERLSALVEHRLCSNGLVKLWSAISPAKM